MRAEALSRARAPPSHRSIHLDPRPAGHVAGDDTEPHPVVHVLAPPRLRVGDGLERDADLVGGIFRAAL